MAITAPHRYATPDRASADVSAFLQILTTAPRVDVDPAGPTVSVVIPTRNERRNLDWLARHMPRNVFEIILVDGGSTDGTVEKARELWPDVRIVEQTRRGKGNALACGFDAAGGEVIVMIDADGSMDPGEIPYFVQRLTAGADYAKGSRFTLGGGSSDITPLRAWGNRRLNNVTRMVHGTRYSDLCYGYNAFWRRILPVLDLDPGRPGEFVDQRRWGDGFEVETLINIRVHAAGLAIAEVASYEFERLFGSSNLNTFRDGARVLRTIALERAVRRRRAARLTGAAAMRPALLPGVFPNPGSDDPAVPLTDHTRPGRVADWSTADLTDAPGTPVTPGIPAAPGTPVQLPGDLIGDELADADRELNAMGHSAAR